MFEVIKPIKTRGIGVDALPVSIKNSTILTGNDLGILGNSERIPTMDEVKEYLSLKVEKSLDIQKSTKENLEKQAQDMLQEGTIFDAFKLLLTIDLMNIK
jgi:hypothetical protein